MKRKHKKRRRYRLTQKGKIAVGVLLSAILCCVLFIVLVTQGVFEYVEAQIVRFSSENPTIYLYQNATDESAMTYITSNNAYGADAVLLKKSHHRYLIQVAGVQAWVNESDVELLDEVNVAYLSHYSKNSDGDLVHSISADLTQTNFTDWIIGAAPSSLKEGTVYYSYDGHYFYDNINLMLSDLKSGSFTQAVNDEAYYNYYQYLPLRSTSSISAEMMDAWFWNERYDWAVNSILTGKAQLFKNVSGFNPLLVFGIAMNESGLGTSEYATTRYNLFGLNAVDSDPDQASYYSSIENCIDTFTGYYLNHIFMNPQDLRYAGGYLGDKQSGINVSYASDPYWGEKAAGYAYQINKYSSYSDTTYRTAVKMNEDVINIRLAPNLEAGVIATVDEKNFSAIVLEEVKGSEVDGSDVWLKIQLDYPIDANAQVNLGLPYDEMYAVGYVHSQTFTR